MSWQHWAAGSGRALGASGGGSEGAVAQDIYLAADAATADDDGPGTIAYPLATLNEAIRRVSRSVIARPTTVHIASAPINGPVAYKWTETLGPCQLSAPLVFIGDGAGQPGDDGMTELLAGTAAAGATALSTPLTGGGMGVDAFFGKTLEITSGAAAGTRRTINSNSAGAFETSGKPVLPAANDTLRVFEPSVRITLDSNNTAAVDNAHATLSRIRGCGQSAGDPFINSGQTGLSTSMIYLINLQFGVDLNSGFLAYTLALERSVVCMLGVEWVGSEAAPDLGALLTADAMSLLLSGLDYDAGYKRVKVAVAAGLVPVGTDDRFWGGWGAYFLDNGGSPLLQVARYMGFLHSNDTIVLQGARTLLHGGRVSAAGRADHALDISNQSEILCYTNVALNPLFLDSDDDAAAAVTVKVRGGSRLQLNAGTRVTKDNQGHAIAAYAEPNGQGSLPGDVSIEGSGVTLTAIATLTQPTNAVRVTGGSRCNYRAGVTVVGAFVAELAVAATLTAAPAAGASGSFAGLAAAGDAYPTVASALTGVNGFIQRH